jgi:predicted aspartyl protease
MSHRSAGGALFVVLLSAAVVPAHAERRGHDPRISPFHLGSFGEPILDLSVNGRGPFRFILDTGSTHTIVTDQLARSLELHPIAKAALTTTAARQVEAIVRVPKIALAPGDELEALASVLPAQALDAQGGIDGAIGQDLLADRVFTLDFERRRILWDVAAIDPQRSIVLTIASEDGRFVAELPQPDFALRLVPDTGASDLVLYSRADRPLPPVAREDGTATLDTVTGPTSARLVRLRELHVGAASLQNVRAAIRSAPLSAGSVDGLLPLHIFRRAVFEPRAGRLTLQR